MVQQIKIKKKDTGIEVLKDQEVDVSKSSEQQILFLEMAQRLGIIYDDNGTWRYK